MTWGPAAAEADPKLTSYRPFVGVCAVLYATSVAATVYSCVSMSAMRGMPMPGGWTMSMMWMRMPGRTWPEAAALFIGMWIVMMVAMMLPSLMAMLLPYRLAVGSTNETRNDWLTTLVAVGYFFLWTLFGLAVYPLGIALAAIEMKHPAVARTIPIASGVVVLVAGVIQFTSFKTRHLGCCREAAGIGRVSPMDGGTAFAFGLHFGLHCVYCCASFTAVLLAIGIMDLRAMALVTAAITVERLAPGGERVAQAAGAVLAGIGLVLITRAAGPA